MKTTDATDFVRRAGRLFGERANRDLALVTAFALANIAAAALNLPAIVRIPLAIPLVFYLPGYALSGALLPPGGLERVELVVVSIGLSIGICVLGGIALGVTPVGLNALSWSVMLGAISVAGSAIALVRRQNWPASQPLRLLLPPRGEAMVLLVAAAAVTATLVGTTVIAAAIVAPPPAQLWMLPVPDSPSDARLGVRAGTPGGDYVIRITAAGRELGEYQLTLAAGAVWERVVSFRESDRAQPIVTRLYGLPADDEIRFVILRPSTDGGG